LLVFIQQLINSYNLIINNTFVCRISILYFAETSKHGIGFHRAFHKEAPLQASSARAGTPVQPIKIFKSRVQLLDWKLTVASLWKSDEYYVESSQTNIISWRNTNLGS